jgi:[ribosomal protein S18]-alanine N-acetyltransferase
MAGGCRIRAATSADLAAVAEIERASFPNPWSVEAFRAHLADVFLVAESPAGIAGYVVAWSVGPEAEILNVAVAPSDRGRGTGRVLLGAAVRELDRAGARRAFLEVRLSNAPARRLYERAGFVEVGRRRAYYDRPREDALILACDLPVAAPRA